MVCRTSEYPLAVRAECDGFYPTFMSSEDANLLARLHIPQDRCLVQRPGDCPLAIGAEGDGGYFNAMPIEVADFFAGFRVPKSCRVSIVSCKQSACRPG